VRIKDEKAMLAFGRKLAATLRPGDVVTLSGPLSAGKTTLVRGLLAGLGHKGEVPSPSFALVQPYDMLTPPVWHVDLYRIEEPSELDELGLDDVGTEGVLLVEWPEHAGRRTWSQALALSLEVLEDGERALTAEVPAAWEGRWPFR
jgi:tRNA threonylcarbamoyladenosine biosynthesis protein TsaE